MKRSAKLLTFAVVCLLVPCMGQAQRRSQAQKQNAAQKFGQIQCARQEGYAYLYSSMTTMEISSTLKCGQQVRILDRSDNILHVQTDSGEDGFVPLSSVAFLKSGTAPKAAPADVKREVMHYDKPASGAAAPAAATRELVLANQTAVHLKLVHAISSATAHVGEEVSLEVAQDVVVNGLTVIAKGSPASGTVSEVETKRRGKGGKVNVLVSSVQLANKEKVPVRSFGVEQPGDQKSGSVMPLMRGKDVTIAEGTELTAYVDGDLHLKISGFAAAQGSSATAESGSPKPQ